LLSFQRVLEGHTMIRRTKKMTGGALFEEEREVIGKFSRQL